MQQAIRYIRTELEGIYSPREIDHFIHLIFHKLLGYSRADLIIHKNRKISEPLESEIRRFTLRLQAHEPIQYILGECEFLNYTFRVRPGVLIPRPETEELVDRIHAENKSASGNVLDIGTGSGCIAVSLARLLPNHKVYAWDISEQALEIASENARLLEADVTFSKRDVLTLDPASVDTRFSVIVSNPPYICNSEKESMEQNVLDYEPHLALFVEDTDPLVFYRRIAEIGRQLLLPGGTLYFEINERFGTETGDMLREQGYVEVETIQDFYGKDRIVKAKRPAC